jgi:hypothetical protein
MDYDLKSIANGYMVFGGTPYYLNMFDRGLSVPQNIDALCFAKDAPLAGEFDELYSSLFNDVHRHVEVIKALARKRSGLTREEIIAGTNIPSGGNLSTILNELTESAFIDRFDDFSGKSNRYLYQLTDFFSLFYLQFMNDRKRKNANYWLTFQENGAYRAWSGYSFELLCLTHIEQIKEKLGISGIATTVNSWRSYDPNASAQIDLIIDRNDGVINLCEMKYSTSEFVIDKKNYESLQNRKNIFVSQTKTKKSILLVMVTSEGLKHNTYSNVIQSEIELVDLFR